MTHGAFGERLKREREMRGVGLEEISAATRISTRFLAALENERWHELPGGVFNRGFIRAVARYLGLDEEAMIAEYALVTHDPPKMAVWASSPAGARAPVLPWVILVLIAGLFVGGWFAWKHYAPLWRAWREPVPPPPQMTLKPPPPELPKTAPAPEVLQLKIDAMKPARVKVIADGVVKFDGRMQAKQSEHFEAKESFEISSDNSSAVLLELNGQIMMFDAPPDAPGRITLDRSKLKKSEGGNH